MQGRLYIIKVLEQAASRSKARMAEGHEPDCLLDFWSQQILKECQVGQVVDFEEASLYQSYNNGIMAAEV